MRTTRPLAVLLDGLEAGDWLRVTGKADHEREIIRARRLRRVAATAIAIGPRREPERR